jgi:23S rRNA (adenine2503-C2)-methyltransferase
VIDPRPNLYGMDREALATFLRRYEVPAFHAAQVYRWLYARHRLDPAGWTDISRALRARIGADTVVLPGRISGRTTAPDGTVKYRIDCAGGDAVEAVCMEQSGRRTLCLSSQIGCALACDFCLTGKMGLTRHLDVGEIVGQAALIIEDRELAGTSFNVVFMGMGEPLHNFDAVLSAIRLLTDADGFALSRRRVTVSTSGLVPAIKRLTREPVRPLLAVSLNATTDEVRDRIMPVNRRHPIAELVESCRAYATSTGDAVTFEYVLLAGVNDTNSDVRRLAHLARSVPAKVNLIPFNPVPGWLQYGPPPRPRVEAIRDRLLEAGLRVSIRWSRGAEARAACGQLALLPDAGAAEDAPRKKP